jgi:hypothetical protein
MGAVTTAVWSFVVVLFNDKDDDAKIKFPARLQALHECYTLIKYIFHEIDNFLNIRVPQNRPIP